MIGLDELDPWNILSWKKYIFKHLKCIFKLKKYVCISEVPERKLKSIQISDIVRIVSKY